jgi:hypothetical protein
MKTLRVPLPLLLLACCPLSLLGQPCPIYVNSLSLNTGINPINGTLLSLGSPDPGWTVIADPSSTTVEPRPAVVLTDPPTTAWGTISGSQWIGAQSTADNDFGDYYYQRCFCLRDGFARAVLNFQMRADNQADVYLNKILAQIQSSTPPAPILHGADGDFWSSVNPDVLSPAVTQGFQFGRNCLIVKVHNEGSYTGLDFAGTITAAGPSGNVNGLYAPACCQTDQPAQGRLKLCKVAGNGITVSTPFQFSAGGSPFTVPAGPAPGGYCVLGPTFPVGSTVTVAENVPTGGHTEPRRGNRPGQYRFRGHRGDLYRSEDRLSRDLQTG